MRFLLQAEPFELDSTVFHLHLKRYELNKNKAESKIQSKTPFSTTSLCTRRSSSCQNGGSCNRLSNLNFECICKRGFTGLYCEKEVVAKVPDAKLDMNGLEIAGIVPVYRVPFDVVRAGKIVGDILGELKGVFKGVQICV